MNMAGVVQGPKRATDTPAAASPAARLAAMRGEDRRGSRPIDTRSALAGTPFASASHSAETSGHEGGQEGHAVSKAVAGAGSQAERQGRPQATPSQHTRACSSHPEQVVEQRSATRACKCSSQEVHHRGGEGDWVSGVQIQRHSPHIAAILHLQVCLEGSGVCGGWRRLHSCGRHDGRAAGASRRKHRPPLRRGRLPPCSNSNSTQWASGP